MKKYTVVFAIYGETGLAQIEHIFAATPELAEHKALTSASKRNDLEICDYDVIAIFDGFQTSRV